MKHIFLFLIVILFTACSVKHDTLETKPLKNNSIESISLSKMIQTLSNKITKKQSLELANDAITYSKYLANEYKIVTPPLFHNTLVNLNIKEKGYCYHFANDLFTHLNKKKYENIKITKIVADRGKYFEHTSLILSSKGVRFEDSIVLDAWRNSGILFFSKVKDDERYKWEIK